ncbi:uncharacterized protein zgc:113423 isoform X2 [Anguilla anguilla]|uniref:uncharacterized protein zgc:113423 isoform X2 n=1 Tax=Anguilla anguilla TaxID=7936 RepID=UPI0015AF44B3|nr:uncharacterized protein zgc:113423 isoform X2 [Anguilla anguilla]
MSRNDQTPVTIKVEEDYDQVLVEELPSRLASGDVCDVISGLDQPSLTDCPKPHSMHYEHGLCDPAEPPFAPEAQYSEHEMEERGYSPQRWRGSGSLTGSVVASACSDVEEEPQMEEVSSAEMDCQPLYESSAVSEDLFSIDHQRTLGEILTYCQVMYEAIQKLDQKFDQLQAKVLSMGGSGVHNTSDSGLLPMPQLVRVCSPPAPPLQGDGKKPPPLSPAPGVPSPPRLPPQGQAQPSQLAQTVVRTHLIVQPLPHGKADAPQTAPPAASASARTARKSLISAKASSHKTVPLEWLGDPVRRVQIPGSALQKAGALANPRSAVRSLLRSVFPLETLTSSNIMGDSARGLKKLDPNKIAAMREWVAKAFPSFDLRENGKDWKRCVSIMNSTARYLRFEAKKHKHKGLSESSQEPAPDEQSSPDPPVMTTTAEIDVELSDSEGDGPSTSRKKTPASVSQQKAPESSSKPGQGSEDSGKEDVYEYLGPPSRQVKVPRFAMFTARLRARPELVARFLIKYLFPEHVLVKSNVYGNREHGIQALDQNKISALREHLKERFPWLLLEESGQDWKACVGAINSTIRKFRHELKKGKGRKKRR